MEVHNCKYEKELGGFDAKKNTVRKPLGLTPSNPGSDSRPPSWIHDRTIDRLKHVRCKLHSKTDFPFFVEIDGIVEFSLCVGMKPYVQEENRLATERFTSSSDIESTRFSWRSRRRCSATEAHAASIFVSGTLRLRRITSAAAIRSSTGNVTISSINFFEVIRDSFFH
jgi:hypothetical protein